MLQLTIKERSLLPQLLLVVVNAETVAHLVTHDKLLQVRILDGTPVNS